MNADTEAGKPVNQVGKGKAFQAIAAELLGKHFGVDFDLEGQFLIGSPPKAHRFDFVSRHRDVVGEAKCITWTASGNNPCAKLAHVNEAVLYLTLTQGPSKRFLVMPKSTCPGKGETLAEYYYRTYRHLLGGIRVFELDVEKRAVREIIG